ncbi:MAG: NAD(P)H-hydrate dehydratase [Sphingobacteriaceae bacterium]|nr:NAD(P)H-hydrate dehydratase [Sphingobacteriaceae bacterium]
MDILLSDKIKLADAFTIQNEPISSIDLMERAALSCAKRLSELITNQQSIFIACGEGNNGGDGFAIARLLLSKKYNVKVLALRVKNKYSSDAEVNFKKLKGNYPDVIIPISCADDLEKLKLTANRILIDAILGTGIKGHVEENLSEIIGWFNHNFKHIISIDVPSGLKTDTSSFDEKNIIHSTLTLSLELPKLAFLMPENQKFVPHFEIIPIGLHATGIAEQKSNMHFIQTETIIHLLRLRNKFDHKGKFGHALILAGAKDKPGAALICSEACLRSGAGLLTLHSCKSVLKSLTIKLPEAMHSLDEHSSFITSVEKPENYEAIAFGPGIGTQEETQTVLKKILQFYTGKLIIDADGLNILSENKTWFNFLIPNTILTPHVKEFERLVGKCIDDFERVAKQIELAVKYNIIVILKGAHTSIAMPDGHVYFNSTGNPGLAKGGSGDALTGIILGLLSRGYNAPQASLIGVYIHGMAADLCSENMSEESILISDVINELPKAFKILEKLKTPE